MMILFYTPRKTIIMYDESMTNTNKNNECVLHVLKIEQKGITTYSDRCSTGALFQGHFWKCDECMRSCQSVARKFVP